MSSKRLLTLAAAAALLPACEGTVNNGEEQASETTDRISVGPGGVEGSGISENARLSEDGRYVVFQSNSANLVPGDTNLRTDIFRRDLSTGGTDLVSLADDESLSDERCETPDVSADGRYVVFVSDASNLTSTPGNGFKQVFRRDLQLSQTVLVSRTLAGVQGNGHSFQPSISPDGNFVAFVTNSLNLGASGFNNIMLKDLTTGSLTLVSKTTTGSTDPGQGDTQPSVSENGLFVAYTTRIVQPGNVLTVHVWRRNVAALTDALVSVADDGVTPGNDFSDSPKLSRNGNLVLFRSDARNLTQSDRTGADIFLRDMTLGETTLVSVDSAGDGDLGDALAPSMSSDGRFIAFASDAGNLVPGDSNLAVDVFVHDRQSGKTARASVRTFGQQTPVGSLSTLPVVPLDGRYVIFQSDAPTLVDLDNNGVADLFLRTLRW